MLPRTISTSISQDAITKVTRLFNNTIGDVLAELIQNARRAGASLLELTTSEHNGRTWLSVTDNGAGIEDPSVLLAFGGSGWDNALMAREDPAGMGVFSLAGRRLEVSSRAPGSKTGWRIDIGPDDWESAAPIAVTAIGHPVGTCFRFELESPWAFSLDRAAQQAACHAPIEVRLHGVPIPREDWLTGAETIVERDGVRIGIYRDPRHRHRTSAINFHGVTTSCRLPMIIERDRQWSAKVDIVDAPQIQLVLPARKEVVENSALENLRTAIRIAIYRHIQSLGSHRLSHTSWCDAEALGVHLPPASPILEPWTPAQADSDSDLDHELSLAGEPILMDHFGPAIEQCAAFALAKDPRFAGRLAAADASMAGYHWYDRLTRISGLRFTFDQDGAVHIFDSETVDAPESGLVENLNLLVEISNVPADTITVPAPVAIVFDESWHCCLDDARIIFPSKEGLSAGDLLRLLEGACFSASSDSDADSWETQNNRFLADAREIATSLLEGEDAALIEKTRAILSDHVQWFVPEGRRLFASIDRARLDVRFEPPLSDPPEAVVPNPAEDLNP